jgi:hypothetical protein
MSKFTVLGVALALLATGTIITAFKLTHRPALAAAAQPLDPAILHGFLQRGRDAMALP